VVRVLVSVESLRPVMEFHQTLKFPNCSRNTVSKVLTRAAEVGLSWPLKGDITNGELHELLFGSSAMPPLRRRPDYEVGVLGTF